MHRKTDWSIVHCSSVGTHVRQHDKAQNYLQLYSEEADKNILKTPIRGK